MGGGVTIPGGGIKGVTSLRVRLNDISEPLADTTMSLVETSLTLADWVISARDVLLTDIIL